MTSRSHVPADSAGNSKAWFAFILVFLAVEYIRPQDLIPIGAIRPAMLTIIALTFFVLRFGAIRRASSIQVKYLWGYCGLLLVLTPLARNNYWAFQSALNTIAIMPLVISIIVCVDNLDRLKTLVRFYIGLMVYVAGYSIFHGGQGSGNYFGDENDVSLFIVMMLPFCYYLYRQESRPVFRILCVSGLVVGLTAMVTAISRGGFIGLLVVVGVIAVTGKNRLRTVAALCVLGVAFYFLSGEDYLNEMSTVTDTTESTASARLRSWATGWDMFLDNLFGVGGGNFPTRFGDYQGDRFLRNMSGTAAHSLWFTLFAELGIIGTFIYFRIIWANWKDIQTIRTTENRDSPDELYLKALGLAFLAGLGGYFASASFISVLYYPHYWYLTALIAATVRIHDQALFRQEVSVPGSGVRREAVGSV